MHRNREESACTIVYDQVSSTHSLSWLDDVEYEADDVKWRAAADQLVNPNAEGYDYDGVVHGTLLNSRRGAAMCFGNVDKRPLSHYVGSRASVKVMGLKF